MRFLQFDVSVFFMSVLEMQSENERTEANFTWFKKMTTNVTSTSKNVIFSFFFVVNNNMYNIPKTDWKLENSGSMRLCGSMTRPVK